MVEIHKKHNVAPLQNKKQQGIYVVFQFQKENKIKQQTSPA